MSGQVQDRDQPTPSAPPDDWSAASCKTVFLAFLLAGALILFVAFLAGFDSAAICMVATGYVLVAVCLWAAASAHHRFAGHHRSFQLTPEAGSPRSQGKRVRPRLLAVIVLGYFIWISMVLSAAIAIFSVAIISLFLIHPIVTVFAPFTMLVVERLVRKTYQRFWSFWCSAAVRSAWMTEDEAAGYKPGEPWPADWLESIRRDERKVSL